MIAKEGVPFGGWLLGHEGGDLVKKIGALMKEVSQSSSLAPSSMWGGSKKMAMCEPESGP